MKIRSLASVVALLAGCQASPPAATQPHLQATSATVAIRPARGLQFTGMSDAFSSTTVQAGSTSGLWGDSPLGTGLYDGWFPFVSDGNGVFLTDLHNQVVQLPALGDNVSNPVLSSGGQFLTYLDGDRLAVYNLADHLIQTFPQLDGLPVDQLHSTGVDAFGDVSFVDDNNQVHVFDTRTGQDFLVPTAGRGLSDIRNVSISGNGQFLTFDAYGGSGRSLYLTNLTNGQQVSIPFVNGGLGNDLTNFQLSSDGNLLLYADGGNARLLDLDTGFIDNLPLLGEVDNARFLDAGSRYILFDRNGTLQVYDRTSNTINTLPAVNNTGGSLSLLGSGSGFGLLRGFSGRRFF